MIKIIYETIHRNKKTIGQIADEMGVSSNTLYRYCLEGESGADLPLRRLIPLMKSTKNYKILKYIATVCGFILVRPPKAGLLPKDEYDLTSEYQDVTLKACKAMNDFFKKPDQDNYSSVQNALLEVMEKSATATKYVEKRFSGQMEMNL